MAKVAAPADNNRRITRGLRRAASAAFRLCAVGRAAVPCAGATGAPADRNAAVLAAGDAVVEAAREHAETDVFDDIHRGFTDARPTAAETVENRRTPEVRAERSMVYVTRRACIQGTGTTG